MKKIFSLALVAVMAISVFAQVQANRPVLKAEKATAISVKSNRIAMEQLTADFKSYNNGALPLHVAPRAKATAEADTAFYFMNMDEGFYAGVTPELRMFYPTITTLSTKDVHFFNASTFAYEEMFGWYLGDDPSESDALLSNDTNLVVPANSIEPGSGFSTTPMFAMESGATYAYGDVDEARYWFTFDPDYYSYMTKCHMYTSGAYDSLDYRAWMFSQEMPYLFGTGLDLSGYPQVGLGLVDTIGTAWGFEGMTTKIDSITIMVISRNASSIEIGNSLKLSLHAIEVENNTMYIDLSNELASHVATANDITAEYPYPDKNVAIGAVTFPIKKNINGLFFICISGLNGQGANFGLYSDGADDFGYGDTYMIGNGNFKNLFGMNVLISVNAAIDESGAQGIEKTDVAKKAVKVVRDGQLIIKRGDKEFNVLGAQL